uniref:Uncharacterized protein n=1 Tax=Anguilla anguilla TaxID=7936 RepID=A0A0E9RLS1_ANGAN
MKSNAHRLTTVLIKF